MNHFKHDGKDYPNSNEEMEQISHFLIDESFADNHLPFREFLNCTELDFSIQSLDIVDQYLNVVRHNSESIDPSLFQWVCLRCGAYAGEVLRKNSDNSWQWVRNEVGIMIDPAIANFGKSIGYFCFLYNTDIRGFAFPVGKVEKYLQNGSEDSLSHFVKGIISIIKMKKASSQ